MIDGPGETCISFRLKNGERLNHIFLPGLRNQTHRARRPCGSHRAMSILPDTDSSPHTCASHAAGHGSRTSRTAGTYAWRNRQRFRHADTDACAIVVIIRNVGPGGSQARTAAIAQPATSRRGRRQANAGAEPIWICTETTSSSNPQAPSQNRHFRTYCGAPAVSDRIRSSRLRRDHNS